MAVSPLNASLSIAIRAIGTEKLKVLNQALAVSRTKALELAKAFDKLNAQQKRLERLQAAVAPKAAPITFAKTPVELLPGLRAVGKLGQGLNSILSVGSRMYLTGQLIASGFRTIRTAAEGSLAPIVDFQAAMAQVRIKGGYTAGQTAQLAEQAKQMGRTTMFGPTESAGAQTALAASGLDPDQVAANMPTVLKFSQAADMGTAESADFLVNVARQFQQDLTNPENLTKIGNVLIKAANDSTISVRDLQQSMKYAGPIANQAGQSPAQLAAMAAILGNSGLKGSQAGTGLRNLFSSVAKPKGGKITEELLGAIGLTKKDVNDGMKDIPSFLELLEERMRGKGFSNAKRIALAASLFGQYGMTAALVLQKAAGTSATTLLNGIEKVTGDIDGAMNEMDEAARIREDTIEGRLRAMKARFETLFITMGEKLAPHIEVALDRVILKIAEWEEQARVNPEFAAQLDKIGESLENIVHLLSAAGAAAKALNEVGGVVYDIFSGARGERLGNALYASNHPPPIPLIKRPLDLSFPEEPQGPMSRASALALMEWNEPMVSTPANADPLLQSMLADAFPAAPKEPTVVEVKLTTEKGTKASVTKVKKGAAEVRTTTSTDPG